MRSLNISIPSAVRGTFFALLLLSPLSYGSPALDDSIERYQSRYGLRDVDSKRVDNRGNGYEPLYGTRNVRVVLNGVVYRGGANNAFHRDSKRNNSNPLPNDGLQNLCEEGFHTGVYLYSTRYSTAPHSVSCRSRFGNDNKFTYLQESPLNSDHASLRILRMVHAKLTSQSNPDPIYLHCWNGWHASGYISSLILRQFCDYTGEDAVAYWNRNTDGNNQSQAYEKIRGKIRSFKPLPELSIPRAVKSSVCL